MSSMYQQWTLGYLKGIVQEELMDYNNRWWSDNELNYYCAEWQSEIQQQLNLIWGTFAFSITGNTNTYTSTGTTTTTTTFSNSNLLVNPTVLNVAPWLNNTDNRPGYTDPLSGTNAWLVDNNLTGVSFTGQDLGTSSVNIVGGTVTGAVWVLSTQTTGNNITLTLANGIGLSATESTNTTFSPTNSWAQYTITHTFTNSYPSSSAAGVFTVSNAGPYNFEIYNPTYKLVSTQTTTITNSIVQYAPIFISTASMTPLPERIEAFYWQGYRLSGRLLEDLEVQHKEWRAALPDVPRMVVQYDSQSFFLWPTPLSNGVLECEYPILTTFSGNSSTVILPFWTQFTAKPYICALAYSRPGPTNDLKKALRYQKQFQLELKKAKTVWANYEPFRFLKLKPGGHYEYDILRTPPAEGQSFGGFEYMQYPLTGTIDGVNVTFTIPVVPNGLMVFRNGLLQAGGGVDYTLTGSTIVFTSPPQIGDLLTSWAVNQLI